MDTECMDGVTIQRGLRTVWLGRNLVYYPAIGSTNEEAKRLADEGALEGTLVIAEEQIAGRGRMGRRWVAPAGSSLLLSMILRPRLAATESARVTMACGLAVVEAIEQIAGIQAGLKWPNDVLIGGRKVAGILTEMASAGAVVEYLVVGVGINVHGDPATFMKNATGRRDTWQNALEQDPSLADFAWRATSVSFEAGRPISRLALLWRFLEIFEKRYERVKAGDSPYREWAQRMAILGQCVRVSTSEGSYAGRAVGVDENGALILELVGGSRRHIVAGDVSLR